MTKKPDLPCADCGQLLYRGPNSLPEGKARCRPCRRANPQHASRKRGAPRLAITAVCAVCGEDFHPIRLGNRRSGITTVCGQSCEQARRTGEFRPELKTMTAAEKDRAKVRRRRALIRENFVESVNRMVVFERDGWICHWCGKPVDPALSGRASMGPTIDHLVPLTEGGEHSYANVALAHHCCNSQRWAVARPGGKTAVNM
jgi:5-methylcytosine-specific restriction endonuclease McrA